ncbi:MAG: TetR/AcrR family transcriptional regulator, partial [Gordonia sp. (in: high G+C Gram-positive bacteria)]|nr:TetR/AcrR family transcriptional regulator [Gordonia sp. (in: high G+C Gram-positive bacteria)]
MSDTRQPTRRTGGRSARVQGAVEAAALKLLLSSGRTGLTMRAVAKEAGVAETTVYRRWPSADHLVSAALLSLADADNPIPDTGSLEGDLSALLTQIVNLLRRPEVIRVVRSAAALDGGITVDEARTAFFSSRFAASSVIVERAVARGELPAATDPYRVIESL